MKLKVFILTLTSLALGQSVFDQLDSQGII
jgi:hypothetical protein